jgi:ubiquinone/menaquinone biosynthesis C-methylase UbiE
VASPSLILRNEQRRADKPGRHALTRCLAPFGGFAKSVLGVRIFHSFPAKFPMPETKSFFTDGGAYERLMGGFTRAAGEIFLDWLALPKGLKWIDVGCGTGAFTQLLLDHCEPVCIEALDPAEAQIAYARATPAAERINFRVGSAQNLPFGSAEFDAAVMALVITFVPEPSEAVAELKRVTKPGGAIGMYMWDFFNKGFPRQRLGDAVERMGFHVHHPAGYANSRMDVMEGYFKAAGLEDIATRVIEVDVTYADFDTYWIAQTELVNDVVQQIRNMSAVDVERLKADLRATLPKDKNGRIAYKAIANAVKGRVPG